MREWLSGGVSPCQGEGRGFESRLALFLFSWENFIMSLKGCEIVKNIYAQSASDFVCAGKGAEMR